MSEPDPVLRDLARHERDEADEFDFEAIVEAQANLLRARLRCCERGLDASPAALLLAEDIGRDALEDEGAVYSALNRVIACLAGGYTPCPYDLANLRRWGDGWIQAQARVAARKVLAERDEP